MTLKEGVEMIPKLNDYAKFVGAEAIEKILIIEEWEKILGRMVEHSWKGISHGTQLLQLYQMSTRD